MSDFFEATGIANNEECYRLSLLEALETAKNAKSVPPQWRRIIRKNRSDLISAANPACRLQWATTISDTIQACFGTHGLLHNIDLFFVTLIDCDWLTPINSIVDLVRMKHKLRSMVQGRSFFFVIEPGYYASVQNDLFPNRTRISWHAHGLMWSFDQSAMNTLLDRINESSKYRTMIPTRKPAHARKITQGDLPRHVGYMVKPPANAYRVFCLRQLQAIRERELGISITPIYKQRKEPLRPGQRIRLFYALKDVDPCDLLVGGGDGRHLSKRTRSQLR
jgi:hypothetical protein